MKPPPQVEDRSGRRKLLLFVAGHEPNSLRARENLMKLCETELESSFGLEVVDVLEDHLTALRHNIMLVPALLVPEQPHRTVILGDLSDKERLLDVLGVPAKQAMPYGK
jgi:circadian clock protein KaiB